MTADLIILALQVLFILCVVGAEMEGRKREKRIQEMFDEQKKLLNYHSETHKQRTDRLMIYLTR